jgi:hypothetical protein
MLRIKFSNKIEENRVKKEGELERERARERYRHNKKETIGSINRIAIQGRQC